MGEIRTPERIKKVQHQLPILFRGEKLHEFLPDKMETPDANIIELIEDLVNAIKQGSRVYHPMFGWFIITHKPNTVDTEIKG